ncbi:hypothetical protein DTW90_02925 [Neorhizobium sp. P12A]|uniref:hypothetical protein n=1 Tax=Neorhizobium sp. P12A TaxID=2268027 RepID=UPI0011EEE915|nr:hypothetical protein [Neorhizobium sp. P12A]KAA0700618.1 hypothetical protein DTW90_02925 [Neorhizobium sp. P12A]
MQLIDPNHPFYKSLWRRILIVAVCLGWAVIEASTREPFWAVLVGAVGIYAAWMLLLNFDPKPPESASEPAVADDEDDDGENAGNSEKRDG